MSRGEKERMLEQGPIGATLLRLGLPMIVSMLVGALYNVVDTYFVAGLGTMPTAAVSAAFPLSLFASGLGLIFGVGGGARLSRLLGARDRPGVLRTAAVSFWSVAVLGTLAVAAVLGAMHRVVGLLGASGDMEGPALAYARPFVASLWLLAVNGCVGNLLVACGEAAITMRAMMAGAFLNMLLDPLLIYGLRLGVAGAAWATLASQAVSSVVYWRFLASREERWFRPSDAVPSLPLYRDILSVGMAMFLLQVLTGLSLSATIRRSALWGAEAMTALGIVQRVVTLGTSVVFGFMKGFRPLAGYNFGAGNYKRVWDVSKATMLWVAAYCAVWSGLAWLLARPVMELIIDDEAVVALGVRALRLNTALFVTFSLQFTTAQLYLSLGRALPGGILNLGRQGLFLLPLVFLLSSRWGLDGLLLAQPAADAVTTLLAVPLLLRIRSRLGSGSASEARR